MTEEQREKLVEDMARKIYVMEDYADHYELSREPISVQREYQVVARAALAVAEEAISKDYRARIAELEKREKHLEEMFHGWRDEASKGYARIAELEAENKILRDDEETLFWRLM
jgi:benzoyl-CoA reductase/2-hydroxyglutaryl-CoA dehydratase subunit BcrC/BadD/HgdB